MLELILLQLSTRSNIKLYHNNNLSRAQIPILLLSKENYCVNHAFFCFVTEITLIHLERATLINHIVNWSLYS